VIILSQTTNQEAEKIIERIQGISKNITEAYGALSISFGVASKINDQQLLTDVFTEAESSMYRQKLMANKSIHSETIKSIINTLFEKSPREKAHCDRVSELAVALAQKMGFKAAKLSEIRTLGLLHDIGKIMISSEILDKYGRLTDSERVEIEQHPSIGHRLLKTSKDFNHLADGVLCHHERYDGKGYPSRLVGEAIPIEARIISVIDAYDAMTASRPYKATVMTKEQATTELLNNSGTQFDSDIVDLFVNHIIGV